MRLFECGVKQIKNVNQRLCFNRFFVIMQGMKCENWRIKKFVQKGILEEYTNRKI